MIQGRNLDPFTVAKLYKYLRVVDVCDALDGIGHFDLHLVSEEIRPLWQGLRFWGPAFTIRCVPANRPMWKLGSTQEIVDAHGIWFRETGDVSFSDLLRPGHVIVMDSGGAGEVGYWGSNNTLGVVARGVAGIVTDGYGRDTDEMIGQRTPICLRRRGRTIIPGRIQVAEVQVKIGCGGAQVRPGDLVGADGDGVVVVPLEVAVEVGRHAAAVLLADMKGRRALYEQLGRELDETVAWEGVEEYYRDVLAGV